MVFVVDKKYDDVRATPNNNASAMVVSIIEIPELFFNFTFIIVYSLIYFMKHCFSMGPVRDIFLSKLKKKSGYSLIEVLIASAIVLTNLGVISSAVVQYGEVSRKQRIITLAMNIESSIHQSISDPAIYSIMDPDLGAGMKYFEYMITTGFPPQPPADPSAPFFDLALRAREPGPLISVQVFPYTGYFNDDLADCAPDFTNKNCVIKVEIDRMKLAVATPTYAFAYRIQINPDIQIQVQNLGVSHNNPMPFVATDFNVFVPQYILLTEIQTLCAPGATAGLTGFNRDNGLGQCLQVPTALDKCDGNNMAKGLQAVFEAPTYKLKLICVPTQRFTCGDPNAAVAITDPPQYDYSMRLMDAKSFDSDYYPLGLGAAAPPGPATFNTCVYTAESPTTGPTFNSGAGFHGLTASNTCPMRYNLVSACSWDTPVTTSQGSCTCCTSRDYYGGCVGPVTHTWPSTVQQMNQPITNQSYLSGITDSISCSLVDNSPVPGACACDLSGAITPPGVSANIIYQPVCSLDADTPNQINAVGL